MNLCVIFKGSSLNLCVFMHEGDALENYCLQQIQHIKNIEIHKAEVARDILMVGLTSDTFLDLTL